MKITLLQTSLQAALSIVQKALPSKPALPVLSSIYFSITETTCTLAATDLYFGIKTTLPVQATESVIFTVPGKQLREIISSLPASKLTLEYNDGTLIIQSDKTKSSLQCQPPQDYPEFPVISGSKLTLSAEHLQSINQYVGFSASTDMARPVLTAVYCRFEPASTTFVATDGFRLSVLALPGENTEENSSELLIPARALQELQKIQSLVEAQEVSICVSQELRQILFTVGNVEVFVRLIEGEFPPYQKILPTAFTTESNLSKQEFEDNLKRALIFARESSNIIRLIFTENKVILRAVSATLGMYEGELASSTYSGKDAEIAFNARYVLEYTQAVSGEALWFGMTESLRPAMFKTDQMADYQYVVMPFKVNG